MNTSTSQTIPTPSATATAAVAPATAPQNILAALDAARDASSPVLPVRIDPVPSYPVINDAGFKQTVEQPFANSANAPQFGAPDTLAADDSLWHQEAEQTLLGYCLASAAKGDSMPFLHVAETIQSSDFFQSQNRLVWRALSDLIATEQPINPLTLGQYFEEQSPQQKDALLTHAISLMPLSCHPSSVDFFQKRVKDDALRRQLKQLSAHLNLQAGDRKQSIQNLLTLASEQLLNFAPISSTELKKAGTLVNEFATLFAARAEGRVSPMGLQTGFSALDQRTLGLHPGQLIVVAGRPGMGKTTLAMNVIASALQQKRPVLFASLEMSHLQLTERFLSLISGVNGQQIKDPGGHFNPSRLGLSAEGFDRVHAAMTQLAGSPLEVLDQSNLSTEQLRAHALKLQQQYKNQGGLGLIVVDYLQLMRGDSSRKNDNRTNEVSQQTRALKILARELNCPVICISQLSRECEKRLDKRPLPSDLRDSGSIEQDADVVLFVYRDEVYNKQTEHRGIAELLLAKIRDGETGCVYVKTDLSRYQFSDLNPQALQLIQQQNAPRQQTSARIPANPANSARFAV